MRVGISRGWPSLAIYIQKLHNELTCYFVQEMEGSSSVQPVNKNTTSRTRYLMSLCRMLIQVYLVTTSQQKKRWKFVRAVRKVSPQHPTVLNAPSISATSACKLIGELKSQKSTPYNRKMKSARLRNQLSVRRWCIVLCTRMNRWNYTAIRAIDWRVGTVSFSNTKSTSKLLTRSNYSEKAQFSYKY